MPLKRVGVETANKCVSLFDSRILDKSFSACSTQAAFSSAEARVISPAASKLCDFSIADSNNKLITDQLVSNRINSGIFKSTGRGEAFQSSGELRDGLTGQLPSREELVAR